jgi:cold-inducible RNA-binding protein
MNIYVGNLAYQVDEDELKRIFEAYGLVDSVRMISDRQTGRPKGFAFVEMPNSEEAQAAIDGVNKTEIQGRAVTVNEARPRTERNDRGGAGGGFRGGNTRGGFGGGNRF